MKLVQIQNARTSAEPPPRSWKKIEETLVIPLVPGTDDSPRPRSGAAFASF